MVVVTIELWPGGDKKLKRTIGVIAIRNDGTGNEETSNYEYELSHAGKFFNKRDGFFKRGKVRGFLRRLSPYRLVYRCLKDAGEL